MDDAANFEEMAAYSRMIGSKRACLGDPEGASYWRGRARGLELAAINVRAAASEAEARRAETHSGSVHEDSALAEGDAYPLPQDHHDRSGTGSELMEERRDG